jgi:hypothetical protein
VGTVCKDIPFSACRFRRVEKAFFNEGDGLVDHKERQYRFHGENQKGAWLFAESPPRPRLS